MVISETSHFSLVHTANPCSSRLCHSAEQCSAMGQVTRCPADHEHSWSHASKPLRECQQYTNLHLKDIQVFRSPNLSSKSHSEPSLVPRASFDLILVLTCVGDIATGNRQSQECKNKGTWNRERPSRP